MTTAQRRRAPRKTAVPHQKLEETTVVVDEPAKEPVAEVVEHEPEVTEAEFDAPVLDVAEQKAKYIAARKLTFRGTVYLPGDPVPGAEEIPRIETWVTHRYLKEA